MNKLGDKSLGLRLGWEILALSRILVQSGNGHMENRSAPVPPSEVQAQSGIGCQSPGIMDYVRGRFTLRKLCDEDIAGGVLEKKAL